MHLSQLQAELERLERDGLLRHTDDEPARPALARDFGEAFVDLSSNDYLGLRQGRELSPGVASTGAQTLATSPASEAGLPFAPASGPTLAASEPSSADLAADVSRETGQGRGKDPGFRQSILQSTGTLNPLKPPANPQLNALPGVFAPTPTPVPSPVPGTPDSASGARTAASPAVGPSALATVPAQGPLGAGLDVRPGPGAAELTELTATPGRAPVPGRALAPAQSESPPLTPGPCAERDDSGGTSLRAGPAPGSGPVSRETVEEGLAVPRRPARPGGSLGSPATRDGALVVGGQQTASPIVSRETATAERSPPAGAGASRLIFGTDPSHLAVEELAAAWLGFPRALLFSTGYAANVGALGCLISPEDAVISDSLNHASLIDGIRLSRARPTVIPHLDLGALESALVAGQGAPARWVVMESYYSMDGDGPDLRATEALCRRYGAHLYLDESHAVGVFGPEGAGLSAAAGVHPDVLMAAFGKAVGSQGACILGSEQLRLYLWNRARSFVFSTAPSPLLCASLLDQLARTREADAERRKLAWTGQHFRELLRTKDLPLLPASFGPICALLAGEAEAATELAAHLRSQGLLTQAIRPPTVPPGQSRLRLTLRADLLPVQLERAASALKACWEEVASRC